MGKKNLIYLVRNISLGYIWAVAITARYLDNKLEDQ